MLERGLSKEEMTLLSNQLQGMTGEQAMKVFWYLRHISAERATAAGLPPEEWITNLALIDKAAERANAQSYAIDGIPLHHQPGSREAELLASALAETQQQTSPLSGQGTSAFDFLCPTEGFPRWLSGMSSAYGYNVSSVTRVKNSWTDVFTGCDYKLWYSVYGNNVTGATARANGLILDFGGGLSGRNEGGRTTVIVGAGRAWLRGMGDDSLKAEIWLL
jgi:hypothetical protein